MTDKITKKQEKPQNKDSLHYVLIPSTVFRKYPLSILETLSKYLKEEKQFNFHQIGDILGRDERNIWTVYNRAKKKLEKKEPKTTAADPHDQLIPSTIFKDDHLGVLETMAIFLKEQKLLSFKQIGTLLNRDQRNIWTVYTRAKKKREHGKK